MPIVVDEHAIQLIKRHTISIGIPHSHWIQPHPMEKKFAVAVAVFPVVNQYVRRSGCLQNSRQPPPSHTAAKSGGGLQGVVGIEKVYGHFSFLFFLFSVSPTLSLV